MKLIRFLVLVGTLVFSGNLNSQGVVSPLKVGDYMPEGIFKRLPKQEGVQLIIIDFWNTQCSGCFAAFPKMKDLQEEFRGNLLVILVNSRESKRQIEDRLTTINSKRRPEKKLQLPSFESICGDSLLIKLFPHEGEPHHVWLDSKGKVIAITSGYQSTKERVKLFLEGSRVYIQTKDDSLKKYLRGKPLLEISHKLINKPLYYSSFFVFDPHIGVASSKVVDSLNGTIRITKRNNSLLDLYTAAYRVVEKKYRVMVKMTDEMILSTLPKDSDQWSNWQKKNCFSYEVVLPYEMKDELPEVLLNDLTRIIGVRYGIASKIEKRSFPALILKCGDSTLLISKAKEIHIDTDNGIRIRNGRFSTLTSFLSQEIEDLKRPLIFLDETGLNPGYRIDITITGSMSNLTSLNEQLSKQGLYIIETIREVEVLILSDFKSK